MSVTHINPGVFAVEPETSPESRVVGFQGRLVPDHRSSEDCVRLARQLQAEGRSDEALEELHALIEKAPDEPHMWGALAAELGQLELAESGIAAMRASLQTETSHPRTHRRLARLLRQLDRPAEALPHFREAAAIEPDDPKLRQWLAWCWERQGNPGKAEVCRRQAEKLVHRAAAAAAAPQPQPEPEPAVVPAQPEAPVIALVPAPAPVGDRQLRILFVAQDRDSPLVACLKALRPDDEVRASTPAGAAKLGLFDFVIGRLPDGPDSAVDPDSAARAVRIPEVDFSGFHPDLRRRGARVYHSGLIMAAFAMGLPRARVASLFNGRAYSALGYFDEYDRAERQLLDTGAALGLDPGPVLHALKGEVFVHVPQRPTMAFHWRLARHICDGFGLATDPAAAPPPDPYARQARWPVYPEIAARLGVPGSLTFKPAISETAPELDLDQLIDQSWRVYDADPQIVRGPRTLETIEILRRHGL